MKFSFPLIVILSILILILLIPFAYRNGKYDKLITLIYKSIYFEYVNGYLFFVFLNIKRFSETQT